MAKRPADRYATGAALIADVRAAVTETSTLAAPAPVDLESDPTDPGRNQGRGDRGRTASNRRRHSAPGADGSRAAGGAARSNDLDGAAGGTARRLSPGRGIHRRPRCRGCCRGPRHHDALVRLRQDTESFIAAAGVSAPHAPGEADRETHSEELQRRPAGGRVAVHRSPRRGPVRREKGRHRCGLVLCDPRRTSARSRQDLLCGRSRGLPVAASRRSGRRQAQRKDHPHPGSLLGCQAVQPTRECAAGEARLRRHAGVLDSEGRPGLRGHVPAGAGRQPRARAVAAHRQDEGVLQGTRPGRIVHAGQSDGVADRRHLLVEGSVRGVRPAARAPGRCAIGRSPGAVSPTEDARRRSGARVQPAASASAACACASACAAPRPRPLRLRLRRLRRRHRFPDHHSPEEGTRAREPFPTTKPPTQPRARRGAHPSDGGYRRAGRRREVCGR